MKDRLYILLNGILTRTADHQDWPERAEDWINSHRVGAGRAYTYFAGIFTRLFWQWKRAQDVLEIIARYPDFEIVLVGHSNGADIICRVLQQCKTPIAEVHLIAGACDQDCERNGINDAFARDQLGQLFVYCSRTDHVLIAAEASHWLTQFGWMGLCGPKRLSQIGESRTSVFWRNALDHCDWWTDERFDQTMRMIVRAAPQIAKAA